MMLRFLPHIFRLNSLASSVALTLIVFGAVTIVLNILFLIFMVTPMKDRFINVLSSKVNLVQLVLSDAVSEDRELLAQRLSTNDLTITSKQPNAGGLSIARVPVPLRSLESKLPSGAYAVFSGRLWQGHGRMDIAIPVDQETWWLSTVIPPPIWRLLGSFAAWIVLIVLASIATLVAVGRFITKPLQQIAGHIESQGPMPTPLPYEEIPVGKEIRVLIDSFNKLATQAEKSEKARRNLLAGVSHDLRTPLARLQLRVETQCEEPVASQLECDIRSLAHIVEQFLAYVQGDINAPLGKADLAIDVVRRTVSHYRDQGVDIHLTDSANQAKVPDIALTRILTNLIDNAIAHGKEPISCIIEDHKDGLDLIVLDAGAGLDQEQLEIARHPFVRLGDPDTSRGNCGLGLAIVDQLGEQMDGSLSIVDRTRLSVGFQSGLLVQIGHAYRTYEENSIPDFDARANRRKSMD